MENEIKELITYMKAQKETLMKLYQEGKKLNEEKDKIDDKDSGFYKDAEQQYKDKVAQYDELVDKTKSEIEEKKKIIITRLEKDKKAIDKFRNEYKSEYVELSKMHENIKMKREELEGAKAHLQYLESTLPISENRDDIINNAKSRVNTLEEEFQESIRIVNLIPEGKNALETYIDLQEKIKNIEKLNMNNIDEVIPELIDEEPEIVEPEEVEPKTVKPETVEPGIVEPEEVEPKTVKPETVEPGIVEPEEVEPETVENKTEKTKTTGKKANSTKTTSTKANGTKANGTKATGTKANGTKVSDKKVTDKKKTETKTTDTKMSTTTEKEKPKKSKEELIAEIERRKDAWNSVLQYTEHAEERKKEYDSVTAKLEAELENLEEQPVEEKSQKDEAIEKLELQEKQVEKELADMQRIWDEAIQKLNRNNGQIKKIVLANRELSEDSEEAQNNLKEMLKLENENEELKAIMIENVITSKKGMELLRRQEEIQAKRNGIENGHDFEDLSQEKTDKASADEKTEVETEIDETRTDKTTVHETKIDKTAVYETRTDATEEQIETVEKGAVETEVVEPETVEKGTDEEQKTETETDETRTDATEEQIETVEKGAVETEIDIGFNKDNIEVIDSLRDMNHCEVIIDASLGKVIIADHGVEIASVTLEDALKSRNERKVRKGIEKELKKSGKKKYAKSIDKLKKKINPAVLAALYEGLKINNDTGLICGYLDVLKIGDDTRLPFDYNVAIDKDMIISEKTFTKLNRHLVRDNKNLGTKFNVTPFYAIKKLLHRGKATKNLPEGRDIPDEGVVSLYDARKQFAETMQDKNGAYNIDHNVAKEPRGESEIDVAKKDDLGLSMDDE